MTGMRNLWRRSWPHRVYADLEPMDRINALIALVLSAAIAVSFAALVRGYAAEAVSAPTEMRSA